MFRYRLVETHAGTLTRRWEMSEAELRRERPELSWLLDEGLASLSLVTRRRELSLCRIEADPDQIRLALERAGIAITDEEAARLMIALCPSAGQERLSNA